MEEDAADQFATTIMLGLDRPWPVYDAAILFQLLGDNRGAVEAADFTIPASVARGGMRIRSLITIMRILMPRKLLKELNKMLDIDE